MRKGGLPNCPQWLLDADTTDENVEVIAGTLVWRGGVWQGGDWQGGVWQGGVWRGGDWWGGVWRGGDWQGGDWQGGDWQGGVWQGGVWRGGVWQGGVWQGGDWQGGVWQGGVWRGGDWQGGDWQGGKVKGRKVRRLHTLTHCDGYAKTLCDVDGTAYILAGCQFFTLAAAREYWKRRTDRALTLAMLAGIEAVASLWDLADGSVPDVR